jgi:DNA-binding NarL/FixJ family response regulator
LDSPKDSHFKLKSLIISEDGQPIDSILAAFSQVKAIKFGEVIKADDMLVWFRLDPFKSSKLQLDWLVKNYKHSKFVVLATIPEPSEAMLAFTSGAKAYVNVYAGINVITQVAEVIESGGNWIGEDMMQFFLASIRQSDAIKVEGESVNLKTILTEREYEVAEVLATGVSNKLIARQLNISERTVKAHVTAIFEKLGIDDRVKLAMLMKKA